MIKHNCEYANEYEVFPYVFKRGGGRCTFCNKMKGFKKTTESVREEFKEKNFVLLEEYNDTHSNVNFLCQNCGIIQNNSRNNVVKDTYRCPSCNNSRKKKYYTEEQFREFLRIERNDEFVLIGEFRIFPNKITLLHKECGYQWDLPYRSMIDCRGCPRCVKRKNEIISRRTIEELKAIVESDEHYELLTDTWVETHSKVVIRHKDCNRTFSTTPNRFIHENTRCYHCSLESSLSHNARRIYDRLIFLKVSFETEYKIEECKHILALPFDFAVFIEGRQKIILIEYDGKQHFKPSFYSKKDKASYERAIVNFELTKKRDGIKNNYVNDNALRYELIRVNRETINDFLEFGIYELISN